MRAASFAFIALVCVGCNDFKPASLVEGVRILGMRADPPEVASGETAMIVPLIVDPGAELGLGLDMGTQPITLEWALCTKRPMIGVDIDEACFDADAGDFLTPLPTLDGGATMLTMPMLSLSDFNLPDATGGLYVPVRLRITAGDTHITAFERLRWKAGFVPPNQNPRAMGIAYVPTGDDGELPDLGQEVTPVPLVEGTAMDLPKGGKLRLRGSDEPGSAESYMTFVGDIRDPMNITITTVTEGVRFFWYASAGKVGTDVTGEERADTTLDTMEYTDSLALRDGLVDLWLVVREERGGVDFLHRQIRVR